MNSKRLRNIITAICFISLLTILPKIDKAGYTELHWALCTLIFAWFIYALVLKYPTQEP